MGREEEEVEKRLFNWLAACYSAIMVYAVLEIVLLAVFAWQSVNLIAGSGIKGMIPYLIGFGAVVGLCAETLLLGAHKRLMEDARAKQANHPVLAPRQRYVEGMIQQQCAKRRMRPPVVVFLDERTRSSRTMVGILHLPFGTDYLVLHPDIPGLVTEKQLAGIVAHELRHSGAFENYFGSITRALAAANLALIPVMLVLTLGVALFDSKMPFIGTIYQFLRHLAWLPLVALVAYVMSLARSRWTEFKTDARACADIGDAKGLIGGLNYVRQIAYWESPMLKKVMATQSPLQQLLSTHPSNEVRTMQLTKIFLSP